jgi:hypothetical protein
MVKTPQFVDDQMRTIIVGVADFKFTTDPTMCLATYALGSCLGITFHDESRRIGGLLHAMLPTAQLHKEQKIKEAMFLDTGIPKALPKNRIFDARSSEVLNSCLMTTFSGSGPKTSICFIKSAKSWSWTWSHGK